VQNNPISYSDPSGHRECEGIGDCKGLPKSSLTKKYYQTELATEYGWNVNGGFSYQETRFLYGISWDMRQYFSNITSGMGKSWMDKNIGGIEFTKGGFVQKTVSYFNNQQSTSLVFAYNTIHFMDNFMNVGNRHVAHEIFHVCDNKMGGGLATFFGGGPADELVKFLGGNPTGLRFLNGNIDVPKEFLFDSRSVYKYANNSNADYYAESLAFLIYPNINTGSGKFDPFPQPAVEFWLEAMIDLSK